MPFGETKVYFDGSHYIAIPHTERKTKKRPKRPEELITVKEMESSSNEGEPSVSNTENKQSFEKRSGINSGLSLPNHDTF